MKDVNNLVQQLSDRQAIMDCIQRYARGIDRHDVELVQSCYHPDALDDHGFYVGPGQGLAEAANEMHQGLLSHQHHMTNHVIEIDGDTAHGETYYFVVMRGNTGVTNLVSGRYIDRFERRDDEWRIAARVCMVENMVEIPTADMVETDRLFAPGSIDRSDLSYRRPLHVTRQSPEDPHPAPAASPV
jgi:ketosteroid isomerase-like protein